MQSVACRSRLVHWLLAPLAVLMILPFAPAQAQAVATVALGPTSPAQLASVASAPATPATAAPQVSAAPAAPPSIPLQTVWYSPHSGETYSVAWGDVDGDGDLDLVIGTFNQPIRLYRNCFFRQPNDACQADDLYLSSVPGWTAPHTTTTESLAWGDVDNDGDLDLAVGNQIQANQLYRNDNGSLVESSLWPTTTPPSPYTYSVAWGDVDNDGDLDLATGNYSGGSIKKQNQLYRNCLYQQTNDGCTNGQIGLTGTAVWTATLQTSTTSVAWGDVDSDGDLDLAVGNEGQPNQIYRNCHLLQPGDGCAGEPLSLMWTAPATNTTTSLAWGHVNSDAFLDLVVGNRNSNQLYIGTITKTLILEPSWHPPAANTYSVALADTNGDGRDDLAVGNLGDKPSNRNQLYLSNGVTLTLDTDWQPAPSFTLDVAWADINNDGQLDLAAGNGCTSQASSECYPSHLYLNTTSVFSNTPQIIPSSAGLSSLAWGDADGDGDLDLAGGWFAHQLGPPFQILQNTGGQLAPTNPLDHTAVTTRTFSVAWGDVDRDGDLDLAIGSRDTPDRIYRNDHGTFQLAQTLSISGTTSVAWGDIDGDGDLDLAVGNDCTFVPQFTCYANQLYRNQGDQAGTLIEDQHWKPERARTTSVAWGDVDGDGDLDLAVGNRDTPNQLYRNEHGQLPSSPETFAEVASGTRSVAWGDADGDGDLDLAVGNFNNPNQLYRNIGGKLIVDRSWAPAATTTWRLAWGDADGDGDLDLAAASGDEPSQLYRNERGHLLLDTGWSPPPGRSYDLAWGDADGDGDLDLAVAQAGKNSELYVNTRDARASKTSIPNIRVARPQPPADANFYSSPNIFEQPTIPFTYTLSHPNGMPVARVIGQYSLDGGGCWQRAVEAGETITPTIGVCDTAIPTATTALSRTLATSSAGNVYTYTWDLFRSGVFGQSDNTVFRLIAIPAISDTQHLPGPYLHGANAASTFPFRVRGTQVQVITSTEAISNALVYNLPAGQASGAQPYADFTGRLVRTDGHGFLQGRGALAIGDRLTALAPITSTETYTLYATNAAPTPTGTAAYTVTHSGVQVLTVSAENPLLLFNLNVALEWDARHDPQFLSQLDYDLKRASEVLYDWSDGQVALGNITIYQAKQHWDDAHIRIYATNRLRPNANKGGVVAAERADPLAPAITYAPGQLRIGAVWNRYGESSGALGEDWPRTLAHELGHYLLYLDDNYIGLNGQGVLAPVETCTGTAMADPYRDDYSEFHPDSGWPAECADTLSNQETRRSDWSTIKALYPRLHTPDERADRNPGPSLLPLAVTQVRLADPPATVPDDTLAAPIFLLSQEDGSRYQPSSSARAFLFKRIPNTSVISDIVDLGRPTLDRVLARGARPGDRVCVYDLSARRLNQFSNSPVAAPRLGCADPISATDQQLRLTLFDRRDARHNWQPDLSVTPVNSTTLAISLAGVPENLPILARFVPSFGPAAAAPLTLAYQASTRSYTGTFELEAPAFAGYVHVWVDEDAPRREIVSDFTLLGSPAAGWGRGAPRGNPAAGWGRGAPVISSDGQVLLFAGDRALVTDQVLSIQATSSPPAPPAWATMVGSAYRVASTAPDLRAMSISFGYLGGEVPPGEERGLRVYFWDAPSGQWQVLTTTLTLRQNNASASLRGPGLYALMSSIVLPIDHAGWNLVAYPAPRRQPMPDALASIDGSYTTVYGYVITDTADPWKVYDAGVPNEWSPLVNDLTELYPGRGYWINATRPITALLKGGFDPAPGTLAVASQLSLPPATYYGLAPDGVASAGLAVRALVNGHLCGAAQTSTLTLGGQSRIVFAIDVRAAGGGDEGCGTPGQPVALTFFDGARPIATLTTTWDNGRVHQLPDGTHSFYLSYVQH